jgi:DNA repair protein RecO (recombination protein O)
MMIDDIALPLRPHAACALSACAEEDASSTMRPDRTEAIILHTHPVRERDKLVIFLTPDHGKRKGWAYGARAIRSRFGASLEPLAKVRISFIEKENDEMVRIESVELVRSLFPAQQKLTNSVAASYLAETVDTFALPDDPSELMYRLLDRTTEALLGDGDPAAIVTYAEIWTLRLGGIFPSHRTCIECGGPIGRPLRFHTALQGFVCDQCAGRESFIVSNEAADALELLFRLPAAEFATRSIARDALFEVRSLAGSLRRQFLGHELKSFDVLTSVL